MVLSVLGHIDHGKTTLIDCLRGSRIAEGEPGLITQGIRAYSGLVGFLRVMG